jgi:hypothetical protein
MKRNNLTTAVLAGITGVAGIASVSNAVNLNSDGVGQVLIYPYYTVNNDLNTVISVVNTTDDVKAIKVRFLEGKNSREVLDFNLYMSAYDVWTAALIPTLSTVPGYAGQDSVKLVTFDNSCTTPAINGQEFLPYAFTGDFNDTIGSDLARATEGHLEMIEMGTVIGSDANAATHNSSGVPASCNTLVGNWSPPTGKWISDASINIVDPDGTGGLFGSASLVDVAEGVDFAYNADAIQNFTLSQLHSAPGDLFPSLITGSETQSIVFYEGQAVATDWLTSSVEAVSASYMHQNLYGEYALDADISAKTEWVVTFPTKSFYVDPARSISPVPVEPFTRARSSNGACEPYTVAGFFDREEQTPLIPVGDLVPSPIPPGEDPTVPVFCWEANVLEFTFGAANTGTSEVLGSDNTTHLGSEFYNGWMNLLFATQFTDNGVASPGGSVQTYFGLPVTGFAVQKFTNSNAQPGLLAQYGGLFPHRGLKNISSASSGP